MGWRYRKRIKIFPGIYLNISKSGISTNVGVKGANVTMGPKGTYVNTGVPGTGLYRRDKVNGKSITDYSTENHNYKEKPQSLNITEEYDKTTSILTYNPLHFIFYFLSIVFPIAVFVWYLNGFEMIHSCIINAVFQAILGLSIILNMSVKEETSSYKIKAIDEVSESCIKREIQGHKIKCALCVIIITLNLFPFLSMNGLFVRMLIGYEKIWDGGLISIIITLFIVFLWIYSFIKEKKFIAPLYDALSLKNKEGRNIQSMLTDTSINTEGKTKGDDYIKKSNQHVTHNKVTLTPREKSNTEQCSQNNPPICEMGKDYSDKDNSSATSNLYNEDNMFYPKKLEPYDPKRDLENYHYPTLNLLKKYETDTLPSLEMDEQYVNKRRIIELLLHFGVEISSIKATVGPRCTLYEITLASGVSINKVRGLEDDLALAFSTHGVRIIAPISNKGTVGIEVPNIKMSVLSMDRILNSIQFQESTMDLPCAIGMTITNEVFMFDLTKAPHVLIAGSTGQGKSVAVNAIITSLLYKKNPAELKLVLMDPYVIELGVYSGIEKHFLAALYDEPTVVTNSNQAVSTLNSLCKEMETRYKLLKMAFTRNIKEYNKKFIARQLNPSIGHKFMPYIVVIIDEYASFISEKDTQFEEPLLHLAELARAVGIHLIITTKRPTNNIITGAIKANFPTRISFRVPESIDSRVILDRDGAERLLGNGDMLYINDSAPVRVQCAFVDTAETERICSFISQQQGYHSVFELPNPYIDESEYNKTCDVDMQHLDPMFEDVARLFVKKQEGSTSLIQREFSIGYNRACRLMDQLETAGVVDAAHGSKPREVLIMNETSLENLLNQWR